MNCIVPLSCSVQSVVRLLKTIHDHSLCPMIYHITNLFPENDKIREQKQFQFEQLVKIVHGKNGEKLFTPAEKSCLPESQNGHWNFILEELPYDEQDWTDFYTSVEHGLDKQAEEKTKIILLMRLADIANSLSIQTIVWPLESQSSVHQWIKLEPKIAAKYKIVYIPPAQNAELELLQFYTSDKQVISNHFQQTILPHTWKSLPSLKLFFEFDSNILELFELDYLYDEDGEDDEDGNNAIIQNPFDLLDLNSEETDEMVSKQEFDLDHYQYDEEYPTFKFTN